MLTTCSIQATLRHGIIITLSRGYLAGALCPALARGYAAVQLKYADGEVEDLERPVVGGSKPFRESEGDGRRSANASSSTRRIQSPKHARPSPPPSTSIKHPPKTAPPPPKPLQLPSFSPDPATTTQIPTSIPTSSPSPDRPSSQASTLLDPSTTTNPPPHVSKDHNELFQQILQYPAKTPSTPLLNSALSYLDHIPPLPLLPPPAPNSIPHSVSNPVLDPILSPNSHLNLLPALRTRANQLRRIIIHLNPSHTINLSRKYHKTTQRLWAVYLSVVERLSDLSAVGVGHGLDEGEKGDSGWMGELEMLILSLIRFPPKEGGQVLGNARSVTSEGNHNGGLTGGPLDPIRGDLADRNLAHGDLDRTPQSPKSTPSPRSHKIQLKQPITITATLRTLVRISIPPTPRQLMLILDHYSLPSDDLLTSKTISLSPDLGSTTINIMLDGWVRRLGLIKVAENLLNSLPLLPPRAGENERKYRSGEVRGLRDRTDTIAMVCLEEMNRGKGVLGMSKVEREKKGEVEVLLRFWIGRRDQVVRRIRDELEGVGGVLQRWDGVVAATKTGVDSGSKSNSNGAYAIRSPSSSRGRTSRRSSVPSATSSSPVSGRPPLDPLETPSPSMWSNLSSTSERDLVSTMYVPTETESANLKYLLRDTLLQTGLRYPHLAPPTLNTPNLNEPLDILRLMMGCSISPVLPPSSPHNHVINDVPSAKSPSPGLPNANVPHNNHPRHSNRINHNAQADHLGSAITRLRNHFYSAKSFGNILSLIQLLTPTSKNPKNDGRWRLNQTELDGSIHISLLTAGRNPTQFTQLLLALWELPPPATPVRFDRGIVRMVRSLGWQGDMMGLGGLVGVDHPGLMLGSDETEKQDGIVQDGSKRIEDGLDAIGDSTVKTNNGDAQGNGRISNLLEAILDKWGTSLPRDVWDDLRGKGYTDEKLIREVRELRKKDGWKMRGNGKFPWVLGQVRKGGHLEV